jgi:predicted TIM-barrel fold metal-dependent hydrolase
MAPIPFNYSTGGFHMKKDKGTFDSEKELLYPHSTDVFEREVSDSGFSNGWGMHFMPVEKYWLDVHTHIEEKNPDNLDGIMKAYLRLTNAHNVKLTTVILPMIDEIIHEVRYTSKRVFIENSKELQCYLDKFGDKDKLIFMLYLDYKKPDVQLVHEAFKMGIKGFKLHNAPLIIDGGYHTAWLSKEWKAVFRAIESYRLPVLWHVTQRLSDAPYVGGGKNSYWEHGWKKGIKYTNEELLQIYLKIVGEYPGIPFISAHQLHLGWERLTSLFDQYENLYTDTTVSCFVRQYDELYDHDREYLRNIFLKYSDRILFGTDMIVTGERLAGCNDLYDGHIRFIRQLRLPDEALQKISHENAEKLFSLL